NPRYQGEDQLRLLPTKADRESFHACVVATAVAGGGDNIGEAYRFFRQKLESDDLDGRADVKRLETLISDRLTLVAVTAERADNVYRIFESLNNTGARLRQADLVRNLLFMHLPMRGQSVYDTVWLPMQRRLTPDQLEDLLYLYLVLQGQERIRRD